MTPPTPNFNAHHAPVGAYLTVTCGHHGTRGGLAAQLGKPADQDLFIGYKNAAPHTPNPHHDLPFFNNADKIDPTEAFLPPKPNEDRQTFSPLADLTREYAWSTDRWKTPDHALEFNIYSPFIDIPDPATATPDQLRNALLPAITAELIIDNRTGTDSKTGFFSINFQEAGNRILENLPAGRIAFAHRAHYGIAAELFDMTAKGSPPPVDAKDSTPFAFLRWWPHEGLEDASNPVHLLGTTPGIAFEIPPGKRYTLRLALACHLPDIVTTRLEGRYLYTRYYKNLEDVLNTALDRFCDLKQLAKSQDKQLANSGLSENQQFLIAHATRSYYANTQLLEIDNQPYWIVNEGEYCMMNTLDLAVDHVFWELDRNPWVVKNLLDNFLKHYSYTDQVKLAPHGNAGPSFAEGGLSFTHDQGTHNQFSPFGQSSYELKDLTGCFSYMTQEQLCNWILIAAIYISRSDDVAWAQGNANTLYSCLQSLEHRIDAAPLSRVLGRPEKWQMKFADTVLTGSGQEITTYDSLDPSLGQARNSLYLATKACVAFFGLSMMFERLGTFAEHDYSIDAEQCALRIASAIDTQLPDGHLFIPAVFEKQSPGFSARILPAIEALLFCLEWGLSEHQLGGPAYEQLVSALRTHTITLLSDKESRNKFPDHGIKLSSTSNNSWLSKIAIVQHVARSLFNLDENGNPRATDREPRATGWEHADAAHVKWLTTAPGAYWCACDQIVSGEAKGSKYYPRLITTALWLREVEKPRL